MGGNPYDPLTTTNSKQELIMADAYLNARPDPTRRFVTIHQSPRFRPLKLCGYRTRVPLFPWFRVSGRWLERAGFSPGQRLSIEIHHGKLIITRT